MNTHEYQAKEVLKRFGVPVSEFTVVATPEEAEAAAEKMGLEQGVAKVQVHAGGRGKAGGVKLAKSRGELVEAAKGLIGLKIVNNQTGPEGVVAHKVMISPLTSIKKEYYVGAVIDRQNGVGSLIVSPEGGMEIEEVAARSPERVRTFPIGLDGTLRPYQILQIAKFMGWEGEAAKEGKRAVAALAKAFAATDASLLEINPLVQTEEGKIVAVDAKLSVDDNALYRQQEIAAFYDETQLPQQEARAHRHDLAYVALDGDIGCMVNGAGLAMATMDIIYHFGGKPANFLDVGGGASAEKVAEGFKIILSDPKVKAILVNIFGGIMNCATLAEGIVSAASEVKLSVPLVVRMEGTNVEKGKEILKGSGLDIVIASDLTDAAEKAVGYTR